MKLFYCCFLVLFLLLPAAPARAQFLWQRAVGTAAQDETAEFMVPVVGGFVTLGTFWLPGQNSFGLFLSKVSPAGDTLWNRHWPLRRAGLVYPRGLFADRAGNLVATATAFAPPATPSAPPSPAELSCTHKCVGGINFGPMAQFGDLRLEKKARFYGPRFNTGTAWWCGNWPRTGPRR